MQTPSIGSNSLAMSAPVRHVLKGAQNVARMSSREIAELTGKKHQHVKRDIEAMLNELKIDASSFGHIYLDTLNRTQTEYQLPRREVEILLTGYSVVLRAKVIDRLRELEAQQTPVIPQSLPEALRLAAELAENNQRLQQLVQEQGEIVDAFDRIALAKGSLTITSAAKHLDIRPKQLIKWMNANRWIYQPKAKRPWLGYQPRIDAGWLEHKVTVISTNADGEDLLASQVRVTPKGLSVLAQKLGRA